MEFIFTQAFRDDKTKIEMTIARLNYLEQFEQSKSDHEVA